MTKKDQEECSLCECIMQKKIMKRKMLKLFSTKPYKIIWKINIHWH